VTQTFYTVDILMTHLTTVGYDWITSQEYDCSPLCICWCLIMLLWCL